MRPLAVAPSPSGAALPILTFHALEDEPASVVSLPPALFERGLARLCAAGWRTIGLVAAVESLRQGRPLPDKSFVLTFDDGYRSVHRRAFPLLQRLGLTAHVFLTTGARGAAARDGRLPPLHGRPLLSWAEVRELHAGGHTFGAHTLTHPDLTRLPPERARAEVLDSKQVIEDALGAPVASFAYPYGRHDRRLRDLVAAHYACACSDRLGLARAASDVHALERVDAYCLRRPWGFGLVPTPLLPWYLGAYRVLRRGRMALAAARVRPAG